MGTASFAWAGPDMGSAPDAVANAAEAAKRVPAAATEPRRDALGAALFAAVANPAIAAGAAGTPPRSDAPSAERAECAAPDAAAPTRRPRTRAAVRMSRGGALSDDGSGVGAQLFASRLLTSRRIGKWYRGYFQPGMGTHFHRLFADPPRRARESG